MKTVCSRIVTSLMSASLLLCAANAMASKNYTLVIENNTDLPTALNKTNSHCMYKDGPDVISVQARSSTQFEIEDKDTVIGECWSAPKTITWKFADPGDGGSFYFDHDKAGNWTTGFMPETGGTMQISAWCGYKHNPKAEPCFGRWAKGDYDYLTVSYVRRGADVVAMNFIQGDDAVELTLTKEGSENMAATGPDRDQFNSREYFYIQKAAGNSMSTEKWKVSNAAGSIVVAYMNVYDGTSMTTKILAGNPPPGGPELVSALCDGRKCLGKSVSFIPKEITLTFGTGD